MIRTIPQRVRESAMAQNALWLSAGQVSSLGVQALYFILLARLLGSREYGVLAGAVTFVSLFSQYSAAGSGSVFLRYVSIDREEGPRYWGNIVLALALFGTLLVVGITVGARYVLNPASVAIVLIVAVSDCFFRQITVVASQVFQAFERMKITAMLTTATNVCRLVTVCGLLVVVRHGTAVEWAWASLGVSGLAAAASVVMVMRQVRLMRFSLALLKSRTVEGFGFSVAASTNAVYNDVDKTLLSHFGMNAANGIYSTAYRVIDIAMMPMWSIYTAALPRMFREGKESIGGTVKMARRLLGSGLGTGVVVSALCYLCAPVIPLLAGKSFAASVSAIRWLALLPVFRAFALSAGAGLTTSGRQTMRTVVQIVAAVFNLGVNIYLIPRYSWLGAAWASLMTDALMGAGNWGMYLWMCRRARR